MRIAVTGATGFVGRWLVKELLSQGDEVWVIVRNMKSVPDSWRDRVWIVESKLDGLKELGRQDFRGESLDAFIHLAWSGTSGMERADIAMQLHNVAYTCDAVRLASKLGCHTFLNAGSIMEYEAVQYIALDGAMPGMGNIYSTAKLCADYMAKTVAAGERVSYMNVIISNIYGPGERSARFLNSTMQKMLAGEAIPLTHGEQLYDFIYVEDAVRAIVHALKHGNAMTSYYIGNVRQRPLKDFILEMKCVLESSSDLQFGAVEFHGAMLTYDEFDARSMEKLGYQPQISFADGLRRTKAWMMEEKDEYKL